MRDVSTLYRTLKTTKLRQWTAKFVLSFLAEFQRERVRDSERKEKARRDLFCRFREKCLCFCSHFWNIKYKIKLDRRHFSTSRARREKLQQEEEE